MFCYRIIRVTRTYVFNEAVFTYRPKGLFIPGCVQGAIIYTVCLLVCLYVCVLSVCLSVYFLALAMPTSAGRFLVKFRLFVRGTALLTKMMMVLWSHGTCPLAANICAVVRPLHLLCGKTVPGFCTPLSFLPLPHQVQAVRAGDGFADDADGPLEPWHMFACR